MLQLGVQVHPQDRGLRRPATCFFRHDGAGVTVLAGSSQVVSRDCVDSGAAIAGLLVMKISGLP